MDLPIKKAVICPAIVGRVSRKLAYRSRHHPGDRCLRPHLSLPPQAATQDFATALGEVMRYIDKWNKGSV